MDIKNITVSFQMTVPLVIVDKEADIVSARKAVKRVAYDSFVHDAEPWDSMVIIDCPDYPALIE